MSPNGIIRIFICLATLAGATLVSCRRTGHEEPVPGTGTERPDDVRVSFRIALGSTNGTRAGGTPEGSYDDGTQSEFENGIDLENGNYRFFFFDAQNRYLSAFQTVELIPDGDDSDRSKTYEVVGKTDKMPPANFKVVALANWPSYPGKMTAGETTIEELCTAESSRYTFSAPFALSRERLIPMYGVKSCEEMTFTPGMLTHLGTVRLLRHGQGGGEHARHRAGRSKRSNCSATTQRDIAHRAGSTRRTTTSRETTPATTRTPCICRTEENDSEAPKTRAFDRTADGRFVAYVPEYPERRDRDREPQSGRRSRNAGPIQGGARQGVYRRIQILQRTAGRKRRRRSIRHPAQLLLQILDFEDIRTGSRRQRCFPTS